MFLEANKDHIKEFLAKAEEYSKGESTSHIDLAEMDGLTKEESFAIQYFSILRASEAKYSTSSSNIIDQNTALRSSANDSSYPKELVEFLEYVDKEF